MDGTTEPLIAVIGHPIAGNPSQFALERALVAMDLDWRVLSFDVPPDKIQVALDGAEVLGIRGVLIDPVLCQAATDWYREREVPDRSSEQAQSAADLPASSSEEDTNQAATQQNLAASIDCLSLREGRFDASSQQQRFVSDAIRRHRQSLDQQSDHCLWLGEQKENSLVVVEGFGDPLLDAPEIDEIAAAKLIVIAGDADQPAVLDVDDWPEGDASCLVVDVSDGHPDLLKIDALGYRVISVDDRRIGTLANGLRQWTGDEPSLDMIRDAIEEYLAV